MGEPLNPYLSPPNPFLPRADEGKLGPLSDCSMRGIDSISDEMLEVGNFTEKGNGLGENKGMGWGAGKGRGDPVFFPYSLFPRLRRQIYSLGVGGR